MSTTLRGYSPASRGRLAARRRLRTLVVAVGVATTVLVAASATTATTGDPGDYPSDMVSYWKLDDGSGTTAANAVGGPVGAVVGAEWSAGQVGGALSFDGVDDYMSGGSPLYIGGQSFTLETWVKAASATGKLIWSDNPGHWYYLDLVGGLPRILLHPAFDWRIYAATATTPVDDGEWHHVVALRDVSVPELRIYVDGELEGTAVAGTGPQYNHPLMIGTAGFTGQLDEMAIYSRALELGEIRDHYQAGLAGFGYELNQPPLADPNGPYLGPVNEDIGFDGAASSDPDDDLLSYDWDWGDTSASTEAGPTPTHAYAEAGVYHVCLTVTDPAGAFNTECSYTVIYDPEGGFVTGGGWIDSPGDAYYPTDLPFFDGSYYDVFFSEEPLHFFEARDTIAAMSCERCQSAHLATVTSQGEYETVLGLFDEFPGAVLGGYQDEGVYPPDAGWQWVTGEPFEFEATLGWWLPGEPNDCGPSDIDECVPGSEQVLEMYSDPAGWNDVPFYEPRNAFTVEYEDCDPGPTGKATFGFVSKYKKGANTPDGNTEFQFHAADLDFHSSSYEWLVVTGSDYARFKGVGKINGAGEYRFMIWAGDGERDTFRIKIWTESEDGVETVVYDNGSDQAISGGSIVIHTKGR